MAVIIDISISLDGYIALPDGTAGPIHAWFFSGDEPTGEFFRTAGEDTRVLRENLDGCGATVAGRRTYDLVDGWGGSHPAGAPVIVVTHEPPADAPEGSTPITFAPSVGDAIARAVERAGDRDVYVMGGASVIQQTLAEGLADLLQLHVSPVLLGKGVRLIDALGSPLEVEPERVVTGPGATHLRYRLDHAAQADRSGVPLDTAAPDTHAGGAMHAGPVIAVTDLARAREFYEDRLGLSGEATPGGWLIRADEGTVVYLLPDTADAGSATWPVASFRVEDAHAAVRRLRERGVDVLGAQELPFELDDEGVSVEQNGIHVAWLRDPDGNVLTVFSRTA